MLCHLKNPQNRRIIKSGYVGSRFTLLIENVRIAVDILPIGKRKALSIVRLDNENNNYRNGKYERCDKGPFIELFFAVRGFISAVEGLSTTGNSTGKSVLSTLLEDNGYYDENCGYKKHNEK